MDEFESMWMEVVVFRIDLMNNCVDRYGWDRCEVDGVRLLAHNVLEEGLLRFDGPDTLTE